jgi:hypothetical protein
VTQGVRPLTARLVDQLIDAGTWVSKDEFQARQRCGLRNLEDALADLVIEARVEFRERVGYRLAGTPLCRRAAQLGRQEGKPAAMAGEAGKDGLHVGVAVRRPDLGLLLYELELPLPAGTDPLAAMRDQVDAVLKHFPGQLA